MKRVITILFLALSLAARAQLYTVSNLAVVAQSYGGFTDWELASSQAGLLSFIAYGGLLSASAVMTNGSPYAGFSMIDLERAQVGLLNQIGGGLTNYNNLSTNGASPGQVLTYQGPNITWSNAPAGGGGTGGVTNNQYLPGVPKGNLISMTNLWNTLTPEQFGAKGDGVTDDSVAIQATMDAMNASIVAGKQTRVMCAPAVSYLVLSNITLHKFVIIGNAQPWSVGNMQTTTRTFILGTTNGFLCPDKSGTELFQGLTFFCNPPTTNQVAIFAGGQASGAGQALSIRDCGFMNCGTGILLTNMDEFNLDTVVEVQCTNGVAIWKTASGISQVGSIKKLWSNCYGEALFLNGQNFFLDGCDIGGLETSSHVLHVLNCPSVTAINCNFESTSLQTNVAFCAFIDASAVEFHSCVFLSGGGCDIGLTNQGKAFLPLGNQMANAPDSGGNYIKSWNPAGTGDISYGAAGIYLTNVTPVNGNNVSGQLGPQAYYPAVFGGQFNGLVNGGQMPIHSQPTDSIMLEGDGNTGVTNGNVGAASIAMSTSSADMGNAFEIRAIQLASPTRIGLDFGTRWDGISTTFTQPSIYFLDSYSGGSMYMQAPMVVVSNNTGLAVGLGATNIFEVRQTNSAALNPPLAVGTNGVAYINNGVFTGLSSGTSGITNANGAPMIDTVFSGNTSMMTGAGGATIGGGSTLFMPLGGMNFSNTVDATTVSRTLMTRKGTIQNLVVLASTSPGASASNVWVVFKNGVATGICITNINGTTGSDTTHTVAVAAGDEVGLRFTNSATATAAKHSWSIELQ